MPFPEKERIVFAKNPLNEVICQLRFPPILKIETEVPAEFQERIRDFFPNFSESSFVRIEVSPDTNHPMPPEIVQPLIKQPSIKNYEFISEDEIWKINLTRNFIALTAKKYERWELFKDKLSFPFETFLDIYKPSHISRIGLRYIDVIKRSLLNKENVSWRNLLNPSLLGILGNEDVGDEIMNFESRYEIKLSDNESIVRILTKFVVSRDDGEKCYMIDSDFFNMNKTPIDETKPKLDFFNRRASRLIQWCISEELFDAMEPQRI